MSGQYNQFSPSGGGSQQLWRPSSTSVDPQKYLSELLAEHQKLGPFMQVFPTCSRLLNQEIVRASGMCGSSSFLDHDLFDWRRLNMQSGLHSTGTEVNSQGTLQPEVSNLQRSNMTQPPSVMSWLGTWGSTIPQIVKKIIRVEVPVDKYPNFNFIGRILGPRGNSLKRVEQTTGVHVLIRGRGSMKDTAQEESLKDKPGYEHLNEPLHILVEAELPSNIIDNHLTYAREILGDLLKPPVDETFDFVKKAQLRELAILNGTLKEESLSHVTVVPFSNPGLKRPKIEQ